MFLSKNALSTIAIVVGVFSFKSVVMDFHPIPTGSMEPGVQPEDVVIGNRLAYGLRVPFTNQYITMYDTPKRGDVVLFNSPVDDGINSWIKRVIAVPGDTVEFKDKQLTLNGMPVVCEQDPQNGDCFEKLPGANVQYRVKWSGLSDLVGDNMDEVTVPEGHLLVVGDNRNNSNDGRAWGFLKETDVYGKHVYTFNGAAPFMSWLLYVAAGLAVISLIYSKYQAKRKSD